MDTSGGTCIDPLNRMKQHPRLPLSCPVNAFYDPTLIEKCESNHVIQHRYSNVVDLFVPIKTRR